MQPSRLLLHHLHEPEHFIRTFVGIMFLAVDHRLIRSEILAPELIDLEAALVDVKMDVAPLKIRGAGLPLHRIGIQRLQRRPNSVSNTFGLGAVLDV